MRFVRSQPLLRNTEDHTRTLRSGHRDRTKTLRSLDDQGVKYVARIKHNALVDGVAASERRHGS